MTRVNATEWTLAQRVLGAVGVTLLTLAVERLANAAMLRGAATISIALGFSLAFGVTGALVVTAVLLMRVTRRTPHQFRDADRARASIRRARPG
jgi:hypothetical protein